MGESMRGWKLITIVFVVRSNIIRCSVHSSVTYVIIIPPFCSAREVIENKYTGNYITAL
jgi:hypothetical protein